MNGDLLDFLPPREVSEALLDFPPNGDLVYDRAWQDEFMDNNTQKQTEPTQGVVGQALPLDPPGEAGGHRGWAALALAGMLALGGSVGWDHFGSTQLQRVRADVACVQVGQQADVESHTFRSGYPAGIGDTENVHLRIDAQFKCGDAVKTIQQWDDARGAMRSDGSMIQNRQVASYEELDLLTWRAGKPASKADQDAPVKSKPTPQ